MVLSRFDMLQGAAGDVKELEYISCLHQTDMQRGIRKNASIQPADIRLFLLSRHGISVANAQVRQIIFAGLQTDAPATTTGTPTASPTAVGVSSGSRNEKHGEEEEDDDDDDDDDAPQPCLDLMELVAILLIPTLLKADAQEYSGASGNHHHHKMNMAPTQHPQTQLPAGVIATPPGLLQFVLHMILHDVLSSSSGGGNGGDGGGGGGGDDKTKGHVRSTRSTTSSRSADNSNISNAPLLTKDLVRSILVAYGEYQLALDEDLLQEMVHVATCGAKDDSHRMNGDGGGAVNDDYENNSNSSNGGSVLNVETFADALTLDVRLYDLRNETRMSTNVDDVFLTQKIQGQDRSRHFQVPGDNNNNNHMRTSSTGAVTGTRSSLRKSLRQQGGTLAGVGAGGDNNNDTDDNDDGIDFRERLAKSHDVKRINTAPAIDITAGTYRSKGLMVALWSTIVLTYFCYWAGAIDTAEWNCEEEYLYSYNGSWEENRKFFGCSLGQSVGRWIVFFITMSIYGVVSVSLGSLGNSTAIKRPWWPLAGLMFVLMLTFGPLGDDQVDEREREDEDGSEGQATNATTANQTAATTESTTTWLDMSREESSGIMLRYVTAIMGSITAVFHLAHVLVLIVPRAWLERIPKAGRWITTGTVFAEMKMKRAAALKLANMTQNALNVVQAKHESHVIETHYGQALKNFEKHGKVYVRAGGFRWAWKRILWRKSFAADGIWLPARFVASNIAQFVMALYILMAGFALTRYVSNSYNKEAAKNTMDVYIDHFFADAENSFIHDELVQALMYNVTSTFSDFLSSADNATNHSLSIVLDCANFPTVTDIDEILHTYCPPNSTNGLLDCNQTVPQLSNLCPLLANSSTSGYLNSSHQLALYKASGLDVHVMTETMQSYLNAAAQESIDSLYPSSKYMVVIPMVIGTAVAFTVAMYLALTYLPSVTTTFLQLRCGHIPSLHDKDFAFYRHAQDLVSILTGSLFWGTLVSSIVVGSLVAFISFLFLWQATIYFAQTLTAIVVGILCIAVIRMSCLCVCRGTMYQAFYRTRPRAANYSMLALEWANLALSVGFVFMRMVKLLIVAGACIGKIDTEFLAEGIGKIGPIYLDAYPKIHRKDILCHEAHRHPYMEQLGVIYMMKLRYRHHFANRAGSCWRLIFVYALMPWLHRYRVLAHPEQSDQRSLSRVEAEHPDLQFVSLRKLNVADGDGVDDESDKKDNDHLDEIGGPLAEDLSSSKKAASVHFAAGEDSFGKIQQLERELENLRCKLRAAGIME